jgi:hypothetical protein
MDDKRNSEIDQAEKEEVEGSEEFCIGGRDEAVQAAGEGNHEDDTKCQKKNGEEPGIQ